MWLVLWMVPEAVVIVFDLSGIREQRVVPGKPAPGRRIEQVTKAGETVAGGPACGSQRRGRQLPAGAALPGISPGQVIDVMAMCR